VDEETAKKLVEKLKNGIHFRRTQRRYMMGALYTNLYPDYKLIDASNRQRVDIDVILESGEVSSVSVASAANEEASLMMRDTYTDVVAALDMHLVFSGAL
jgi:hypothetical protein